MNILVASGARIIDVRMLGGVVACLALSACGSASSIQGGAQSGALVTARPYPQPSALREKADALKGDESIQHVEAILGPSDQTCWEYSNSDLNFCFRGKRLTVYSARDLASARDLVGSERVDEVKRLRGQPLRISLTYHDQTMSYVCTFANNKLQQCKNITPVVP